mmetsp:Transcript_8825/g.25649  ORF Transcript_8825/g.25649 Transcript_8825/m.25649 type:complete len:495 (-) Transcript_8825:84-1568(-)
MVLLLQRGAHGRGQLVLDGLDVRALLRDDAGAEALGVVRGVERGELAWGEALVRHVELDEHLGGVGGQGRHRSHACAVNGPVSRLHPKLRGLARHKEGLLEPGDAADAKRNARLEQLFVVVGDDELVGGDALAGYKPRAEVRVAAVQQGPEAAALADGVEPEALVLPDHLAGCEVADDALGLAEVCAQEVVEGDLAQEADALAVLARRRGQAEAAASKAERRIRQHTVTREGAHHRLVHAADREDEPVDLVLAQRRQEVCLVFEVVAAAHEAHAIAAGIIAHRARIVARGNWRRGPPVHLAQNIDEGAELYAAVAHNVRVRCAAGLGLGHRVAHDAVPVGLLQAHALERHRRQSAGRVRLADLLAEVPVLLPGAIAEVRELVLEPDAQVVGARRKALALQQPQRHAAVHTAAEQHRHFLRRCRAPLLQEGVPHRRRLRAILLPAILLHRLLLLFLRLLLLQRRIPRNLLPVRELLEGAEDVLEAVHARRRQRPC